MGQRLFIRRAAYLEIDKFPEAIGRRATAVTVTNTNKFHGQLHTNTCWARHRKAPTLNNGPLRGNMQRSKHSLSKRNRQPTTNPTLPFSAWDEHNNASCFDPLLFWPGWYFPWTAVHPREQTARVHFVLGGFWLTLTNFQWKMKKTNLKLSFVPVWIRQAWN